MEDLLGVSDDVADEPFFGDAEGSTPEPNEKTEGVETPQGDAQKPEGEVEAKPADDTDKNFKALRETLRQLKSQNEGLTKDAQIAAWAKQDPKRMGLILGLMQGKAPEQLLQEFLPPKAEAQADPFADYDPIVADQLRKVSELERAFKEREEREKAQYENYEKGWITQNMSTIDVSFDGLMDKRGLSDLPEEGKDQIASSVYNELKAIAGEPERATQEDLKVAFDTVMKRLDAVTKHSLGKASRPSIPASGSSQGVVPGNTKAKGVEGRLERIVNSL